MQSADHKSLPTQAPPFTRSQPLRLHRDRRYLRRLYL